ncbi:hypothetical protein PFICI_10275 [Pestalotiopsis fici W106-1]|uniref:Protein kinase domain-containing protein n=1 Tax=Pestalotiopsis fici (strain W106-1 / CGMCC3.15140) TaxID=1229662 RepID=W3WWF4_PESFW|nr:uncharacterized protein PFICI_10275 [Pestalotiopsis fici W106-1]ETS78213.1 hypothetical protein PFICI_10275 [Pestalotiopsis fici W106-1]
MVHKPDSHEPLPEIDFEPFEQFAALNRSLKYEFGAEKFPGLWKVSRKSDRFEFLARDVSHRLQDAEGNPTPLSHILHPNEWNIMTSILRLLNHENLINLVDWIQIETAPNANLTLPPRDFFIWDYCNAGTLENMLFDTRHTAKSAIQIDQEARERQERIELGQDPDPKPEPQPFLPEAFCWHVLCSLLSALAWLHDGIREDWDVKENDWVTKYANIDWMTVLHRNITPRTIWFCHPQTPHESFGLCKLGNFKHNYISGVYNGILDDTQDPSLDQIAMAPQMGVPHTLAELRNNYERDPMHPPGPDQTYTITSEYRAVADVISSMMIHPIETHIANRHFDRVRQMTQAEWTTTIGAAPYTDVLKNFVFSLYARREYFDLADRNTPNDRKHMSWKLYKEGQDLYQKFRTVKDEGKATITTTHVQIEQWKREKRAEDEEIAEQEYTKGLVNYLQTTNRFAKPKPDPTPLDNLLADIKQTCKEVDSSNIRHTQFLWGYHL